jgi:hypothetical protein
MPDDLMPIFVSCGRTSTPTQEQFVLCIEAHLRSHGCQPQTVGRNVYSIRQPVEAARELIAKCSGAVVIAFERTRILSALDKPGSADEQKLPQESHPTVWNHLEAAMAYAQNVPLLIIVEQGLRRQGMLSDRLEWIAIETDLTPSLLSMEQFQQIFREWLSLVKARATLPRRANLSNAKWTVRDVFGIVANLEAKDAWAVMVAIFAILAAIATASYTIGQWTAGAEQIGGHKAELGSGSGTNEQSGIPAKK